MAEEKNPNELNAELEEATHVSQNYGEDQIQVL